MEPLCDDGAFQASQIRQRPRNLSQTVPGFFTRCPEIHSRKWQVHNQERSPQPQVHILESTASSPLRSLRRGVHSQELVARSLQPEVHSQEFTHRSGSAAASSHPGSTACGPQPGVHAQQRSPQPPQVPTQESTARSLRPGGHRNPLPGIHKQELAANNPQQGILKHMSMARNPPPRSRE